MAGPFGHPSLARRRRVKGATSTRRPDAMRQLLPRRCALRAALAHGTRPYSLRPEDAVPGRYDARDLRAAGFSGPPGRSGAEPRGESDALPRGVCTESPLASADRARPARPRWLCRPGAGQCGANARRDDLGAAPQTRLRHRDRVLPTLWRRGEDHRQHRRSAGHLPHPRAPGTGRQRRARPPASPGARAADRIHRPIRLTPLLRSALD
jgi:hypothetical protein